MSRPNPNLLALAACASLSTPLAAQGGMQKLFASDPLEGAEFGWSGLALDRGRLFASVTRPGSAGGVHVFEREDGAWVETQKVTRPWPGAYDAFGATLDADGGRLAVGGPGNQNATIAGRVYLFEETTSGWLQTARVEPPDGAPRDHFGASIALEGDLLVVGAPDDDRFGPDAGAVFVFRHGLTPSGQLVWTLERILAPEATLSAHFGRSVALSGERILVGTFGAGAYVYRHVGDRWLHEQTLEMPADLDGEVGDAFGAGVCLDGNLAAVSAPYYDPPFVHSGIVVVFERGPDGWVVERELPGPQALLIGRCMGERLALHSGLLLASGDWWNVAYAFRLTVPDSPDARRGTILRAGGWNDGGGERYSRAMALDDDWVAVGVPGDDERERDAGAVYVQRRTSGDPPVCCQDIGERFCGPSNEWAGFKLDGSLRAEDDRLYLQAGTYGSVAVFLMSRDTRHVTLPGHEGALCVGGPSGVLRLGGEMTRFYSDQIVSLTLGTRVIPGLATGIVPGSTWYFQAWSRNDYVFKGFTNAASATFR